MGAIVEIFSEFFFDAAHHFRHFPEGHKYRGLHGHSFRVEVALRGTPDETSGFVFDLEELERACAEVRGQLDHAYLNDIAGLEQPSLEHIAAWIWQRLAPRFAALYRISVRRDSCKHGCTYYGSNPQEKA